MKHQNEKQTHKTGITISTFCQSYVASQSYCDIEIFGVTKMLFLWRDSRGVADSEVYGVTSSHAVERGGTDTGRNLSSKGKILHQPRKLGISKVTDK